MKKSDKALLTELANSEPLTVTLNRMTTFGLQNAHEGMARTVPQANLTDEKLVHMGVHFLLVMMQTTPSKEMQRLLKEAMDNAVTAEDAEVFMRGG